MGAPTTAGAAVSACLSGPAGLSRRQWVMRGTRIDGSPHLMSGVVIFEVRDDVASAARFYLEPVERGGPEIDEAVRQAVGRA